MGHSLGGMIAPAYANRFPNNIISVYSLQGIMVRRVTSYSNITKIKVNDLSPGVYFLEVLNDKGKEFQKVIIK